MSLLDLNQDISLWLSLLFMAGGLAALSWSSDRFVVSSSVLARALGISPLIVGIVIVGFGTSMPEFVVSVMSGVSGHADISLGNAYGSCIFNLAAILGIGSMIRPMEVKSSVNRFAVPVMLGVTLLSYFLVRDYRVSRLDASVMFATFAVVMPAYCLMDQKGMVREVAEPEADASEQGGRPSLFWTGMALVASLAMVVVSSHALVWGCVDFARDVLHVSELFIGLTVVAIGTSLPELATTIQAARRNESELAVGNIFGSNVFNMLVVVGTAGMVSPFAGFSRHVVVRDLPVMALMAALLFVFGFNWRRPREPGRISRPAGAAWLLLFVVYLSAAIGQEIL